MRIHVIVKEVGCKNKNNLRYSTAHEKKWLSEQSSSKNIFLYSRRFKIALASLNSQL